jgi:transcriptional regulator with XRE-family HTH domain
LSESGKKNLADGSRSMIGQRLKLARAASGLSLREVEAAIRNLVTAQAIGKYERNEDMPSSRVLSALAEALHVSEDYLLSSDEMVLDGVEFRKKDIASKREEAFVEGQTLHLLERYLTLEDALGLASVVWDRPAEPRKAKILIRGSGLFGRRIEPR